MDTPGFLYQAPNSVLLGPRDPNGKLRSQRKDSEAGLLPLAQPQRKRGNCGGPWEGLGGRQGGRGRGRQGGTQLTLLPSEAEVEPLPAAPSPLTLPPASLT